MNARPRWLSVSLLACVACVAGCDGKQTQGQSGPESGTRPNILFVVWDTVRADHLSLYGYERRTTPYLDEFARQARVFENCISVGSTTVPAHSSMFTGLLPSEHGTSNEIYVLPDGFDTLAELLGATGYDTYMFSANPFVAAKEGYASLTQGFEVVEYPWSPQYSRQAIGIMSRKVKLYDRSNPLADRMRSGKQPIRWNVKACGELARKGAAAWLSRRDRERPFFIFINYMEAHAPLLPPDKYRKRMMSPEQVRASYNVDRHFMTVWRYVFGFREYTAEEIALTVATYDATMLELDDLFRRLIESLRAGGHLDDTIVVLVGDHGDHMGEHHMLDHQYSVYEPLMRIPLVVHYPKRLAPGRDTRPVTNLDLFPTLLELAGVRSPLQTKGINLLHAPEKRVRLGECPHPMYRALRRMGEDYPRFDPTPWERSLRAYYDGPYKFIQGSNGRHELYNLVEDPGELRNLLHKQPGVAERLEADLRTYLDSLDRIEWRKPPPSQKLSRQERHLLELLGYVDVSDDEPDADSTEADTPSSRPAPGEPTSKPQAP